MGQVLRDAGQPDGVGRGPSTRDHERAAPFVVVPTAIPAGIRCSACGRLHLPHRLRPLEEHPPRSAGDHHPVMLHCPRCGNVGALLIDASDPAQQEIRDTIVANGRQITGLPDRGPRPP